LVRAERDRTVDLLNAITIAPGCATEPAATGAPRPCASPVPIVNRPAPTEIALPRFRPRFSESRAIYWSSRYDASQDVRAAEVGSGAKHRGRLTKSEFQYLCKWKSPRAQPRCRTNSAGYVSEVSAVALSTSDEELRIRSLMLLRGVSWPTASVILHFCHRDPYPILDVRALWSLGVRKTPAYNLRFWSSYCAFSRRLARRWALEMRELDRALWQFSKENQP
jgi:hypothetical protein